MSEESPKILIVEDDPDLTEVLAFQLRNEGYAVETAADGLEALRKAEARPPDLVVLDLMLPRLTGLQVCQRLRAQGATAGALILMLTARGEEMDRIVGFEMGADDYMTKPFSTRELVLRIQAMLRRRPGAAETARLEVGPLALDPARREAKVNGRPVELTPLEYRLLEHLMQTPGQVRSRETLLDHVWGYSSDVHSRTVDTHIRRLRDKLGEAADWVETVRGFGYRVLDRPPAG